jgi:hypothetical protein
VDQLGPAQPPEAAGRLNRGPGEATPGASPPEGKARSALNGKFGQKGPRSEREVEGELAGLGLLLLGLEQARRMLRETGEGE